MFPYLIAGAIGFAVAKIFEDDESPKYADGGSLEEGNNNVLEYLFNNTEDITPIKINGRTIGGIDVTTYRGDTETLRVHKMLILPEFQGKGIGSKAINKLFRENPNVKQIIGNATTESKSFWQKIGAEFHSNEHTAFTITRNPDIRFDNGGTTMKAPKLLAPNGKPSNLTPEQYKLVRTPEFKTWFGDWENNPENASKVVDENGEPLICNHSSRDKNIDIFYGGRIFRIKNNEVKPIWFNYERGFVYATGEDIFHYESFLNIRKMFDYSNEDDVFQLSEYFKKINQKELPDYDFNMDWEEQENFNLPAYIFEMGYDGYKFTDEYSIVVFNSNQIKLADGTNTTFDGNNPDIRYKTGGEIKDLIVLHNINAHQIEEANYIGGLVTPSIAIVKAENSFTDFGSITLIGTKELIDPENRSVKVFSGDVYSPSVPRKLYYVDKRLLDKITNDLIKKAYQYDGTISKSDREIYGLVKDYIGDYSDFEKDLNTRNIYELNNLYFDKLKLVYIVEKGIKIKVPMKDKKSYLFNNLDFTLTPEQKKRFAPILREYTTESNEKGSSGVSKEIKSKVYDLFLEVLNNEKSRIKEKYKDQEQAEKIYEIMTDGLDESFEKNIGTRYDWYGHSEYNLSKGVFVEQTLDKEKFNENIKKIFTKQVIEDYKKWLSDFINQFRGRPYFLKGNEKVPYSLDYLVDATSNRVVGQEKNITFGVNQAKSFGTKKLNSIDEIKKNSNKLISKDEMNLIDKKNSEDFFNLSEKLKYEYESTWNKLDSLGKALADYYKGTSIVSALRKNDFKTPSSYQIDLFKDFADELKNSPVDYFEAKYQRAVYLKEFKYAVVPKETTKEVIQILLENGLIVKKYQTTEERIQIVNSISNKDKSIKFADGGQVNFNELIEGYELLIETETDKNKIKIYKELIEGYELIQDLNNPSNEGSNSILLAPNGKPSKLTPEQYKLVRTPEFKAWFGDWENDPENASKVIDEETKEPLVVYHRTYSNFYEFDNNKNVLRKKGFVGGNLFYFSDDRYNYSNYGDKEIECFINLINPTYKVNINGEYISRLNDGAILKYDRFGSKENVIISTKSNQIKLADGTNTTFDGGNPDIRFERGGQPYDYSKYRQSRVSSSKLFMPNVRGGWTEDKIIRYLKQNSSDTISTYRLPKYISQFDNWQQFKEHIFYHGTSNYFDGGLKPSITMSERQAERNGGGGYGQRYFGVSLTSRKKTAESFSGMSNRVIIYPLILKRDAKVIERTDLKDASEIEDIIVELYEQGVDAVWIGGGEEELVVINPFSVLLYGKGYESHSVYGGFKSIALTDEKIKEIYDNSSSLWETYSKEYSQKQNKEEKNNYFRSLPKIQFDNGGEITTYTEFYDNLQIEDGSKYIGQKFGKVFPFLGRRKKPNDFRILLKQYYGIVKRMEEDDYSTKAMKQTDLNKFKSSKSNIDKKKYLAGFYLDSNGIINKFVK